ncbi:uncharacterized protein with PQ loop repeat [Sphingomonas sp. BE138]|uniref:SemiSWEET family transporter n=1 Tax=Sphingomonas sp. BE138 TaxID=2817845 RepID=UPI0028629369|nr:SemiSWEET family transporter [Sphingomonas sp. BE138]MDR6788027.1 uncharacterized protein with PQ loop repeat [Sphingomonas sp. BE138]
MDQTRTADRAMDTAATGPVAGSALKWLGWIATTTAIFMFVSYVDQIRLNLAGQKGSIIMPIATVVNCSLWTSYGALRRDWPVAAGNFPGVILGLITVFTAL